MLISICLNLGKSKILGIQRVVYLNGTIVFRTQQTELLIFQYNLLVGILRSDS